MTERCPNCGHASGYWRRSSEDWRCRRCGYTWSADDAETPLEGEEEPRPRVVPRPAVAAEAPALVQAEVDRILKERAEALAEAVASEGEEESRLLVLFALGEEWYSIDVDSVREIHRECALTPIPGTPDYVWGVVNLRGEIISVTDLATLLGLGDSSEEHTMVICQMSEVTTALRVGGVSDIVSVRSGDIEPPLATLERLKAEHVVGQFALDDRLVTILDLDKVLTPVGA